MHQKTFKLIIITLALVLIKFIWGVHGSECVDVSNPQVRSFSTLLNLQANKVSFEANSSNFAGNYIAVQEDIENLGRNSFICYTSSYITKVFMNNNKINQIEDGAFISLNCVMVLDLYRNLISSITRETFEGFVILHELNLGENKLREVPEHAFTLLPRLKVLNLTRNSIKVLHPYSFYNLSLLEQLDISYNYLQQFVPDILKYFGHLMNLQLGSNQLKRVEFEKWELPNLQKLNLSNNVLVSFDTSYDFTFGATLKELYIDQNYLTRINPYGLRKHFPNLSYIDINYNPWSCPHLLPLVTTLNDTRVSFRGLPTDNGPNIEGIACNRSLDYYTKSKVVDVDERTVPQIINSSTTPRSNKSIEAAMENILQSNLQLLESTKKMTIAVVALLTVVIIFIAIDISVRSGLINSVMKNKLRLRNDSIRNVSDSNDLIENARLLQDRY